MRFVLDGPDIPRNLMREWRAGKVVLLAGAGVSVPSQLPLFGELALKVYERLEDPLFSVLRRTRRCVQLASMQRIVDDATLSPRRRIEAGLFLGKQFDRLFSAMEGRIDLDERGRPHSERVRNAVADILGEHTGCSAGHRDLLRISTPPAPSRSMFEGPNCRIGSAIG